MWYPILITVLISYLLGNLNGSVCMSALRGEDDVRSHGSGNAGLTNFVRNFGPAKGVLVILIDAGKTVLSCLLGGLLLQPYELSAEGMIIAAVAVTLGHDFPVLLGGKGGKGILCGISAAAVIDWRAALIIFAVFGIAYLLTGYISLGSILGAATYCITFSVFHWDHPLVAAGGIFIGLLAIFMHRANIRRLFKGQEPKTSLLKKEKKE